MDATLFFATNAHTLSRIERKSEREREREKTEEMTGKDFEIV